MINVRMKIAEKLLALSLCFIISQTWAADKVDSTKENDLQYPDCAMVQLELEGCLTSYCKAETKIGVMYRFVKGFDKNGLCLYVERAEGLGGMDCALHKDDLADASILFEENLLHLQGLKKPFSENKSKRLNQITSSSCKNILDYNATYGAPVGVQGYYDPELEIPKDMIATHLEIRPSDTINEVTKASDAVKPQNSSVSSTKKKKAGNFATYSINRYSVRLSDSSKSMMFTTKEVRNLLDVIGGVTMSGVKSVAVDKNLSANLMYLNGMIYYAEHDWSFWLNGIRYSSTDTSHELNIINVTKSSVKISVTQPNLDRISPNWHSRMEQISDSLYESRDRHITILQSINKANNNNKKNSGDNFIYTITFELKPNQTFDMGNMDIIEGHEEVR